MRFSEKNKFIHFITTDLFINSFFLLLSNSLSAFTGFVFWILAAKYYNTQDMGIATALISTLTLLLIFSKLGFDQSIVRFFPSHDKNSILYTSIISSFLLATVFTLLFILGIDFFSPKLYILKDYSNAFLYLLILFGHIGTTLTGAAFIAIRKAKFQYYQNILLCSRLLFLLPLLKLGSMGVFCSLGMSLILTFLASIYVLTKGTISKKITFDTNFLRNTFSYSIGNYLEGLFSTAPNFILPIMALNVLGAEETAFYYVPYSIVYLLFQISTSVSMSLFVEGSHGEPIKKNAIKSSVLIFLLILPLSLVLYFKGYIILGLIKDNYVTNSFKLMQLLVISSFPVSLQNIYFSVKRIQKDVMSIILLSGINAFLLLSLSHYFMQIYGILGIGYAWILSYSLVCIIIIVSTLKNNFQYRE